MNDEEEQIVEHFKSNLKRLKNQLEVWNIKPIFITQITYNINGDKILYFLNKELKNFSMRNNYSIIKLDELIDQPLNNFFMDTVHTNKFGSEKLSKILYPYLIKEIKKNLI